MQHCHKKLNKFLFRINSSTQIVNVDILLTSAFMSFLHHETLFKANTISTTAYHYKSCFNTCQAWPVRSDITQRQIQRTHAHRSLL